MTAALCTVFFLPGLGLAADSAEAVADALDGRFRLVGIDLPGHGGAPDAQDGTVDALVDAAVATIVAEATGGPWILCAHSMGGKVAALIAARVLRGEIGVFGLGGLVLLAPSPPTPEPMADDQREKMLSWVEDGPLTDAQAREFLEANVADELDDGAERRALDDLARMSPVAWRRWLAQGSEEDVSGEVGRLDVPVTVLAGEDDEDLGASAQPDLLADVYPRARFVPLPSTGHLLQFERPREVALEITRMWDEIIVRAPRTPYGWGRVIASDRTDVEMRGILARRAIADDADYVPETLSGPQLEVLRELAQRLVPQGGDGRIDLAARVDRMLTTQKGDGWRPAGMPTDPDAYRAGLDAIASVWSADRSEQDRLISGILDGDGITGSSLDPADLTSWLDDARNDLMRLWLSHPASFARVGYDGFATGGTGPEPAGYLELAAGIREDWEPIELGRLSNPTAQHETAQDGAAQVAKEGTK